MGKLHGMTCYGAGNMDGCSIEEGKGWRIELGEFLKQRGIFFLDPYDKPTHTAPEGIDFIAKRAQAMTNRDYDTVSEMMRPVRVLDLRFVDRADFVVCNLDLEKRPFGSIEEIVTANRQKKPVIVRCKQGKDKMPYWAFAMLRHELFFDTWNEVKTYLINVDEGNDTRSFNRWQFFDWSKLIEGVNL